MRIRIENEKLSHERSHVGFFRHRAKGDALFVEYAATKPDAIVEGAEFDLPATVEINRGGTVTKWRYHSDGERHIC